MSRIRVYVSGPITRGDRNWNQYQANVAHRALIKAGYAVLNPMMTGVLPFAWEPDGVTHEEWLESDFAWIEVADAILRLPGDSVGADMEVAFARELGIPIFFTLDDLYGWEFARDKSTVSC